MKYLDQLRALNFSADQFAIDLIVKPVLWEELKQKDQRDIALIEIYLSADKK